MNPRLRRWAIGLVWLACLAGLGAHVAASLKVGTDLRLFMPAAQTAGERLLLEELGEGPASRLLLLAIDGDGTDALAQTSRTLVELLADDPNFRLLTNGEDSAAAIDDALLPYRYLLGSGFDRQRLDAASLRAALNARLRDLASPAAAMVEPWLARDPTLQTLQLAQAWQPAREPHRVHDLWFSTDETSALLIAETVAPGFDPDRQRIALDALQRAFDTARGARPQRMAISGPGAFAVLMKERTASEATTLGLAATAAMLLLLIVAYRQWQPVVLSALPLLSAGVAGLAVVGALFDSVHGITLAFGFTLIGVAQDYPIHLFSHQHPRVAPRDNARALWPTLVTGVASTCIAYAAFVASGVTGLAQLGCFTISGLAVAALSTRFLLPQLMSAGSRDHGALSAPGWFADAVAPRQVPRAVAPAIAAVGIAIIVFAPGPLWENNLGALTPLPPELLQRDIALRTQLGAPDVRYLLVSEAPSVQGVLEAQLQLEPALQELKASGAIGGFDFAARYLPPIRVQQARQAALPDPVSLRAALAEASVDLPFATAAFEPFLADIERARQLPALDDAALAGTPLELRVGSLLVSRTDSAIGLIALVGVADPQALAGFAARSAGQLVLLDMKGASEQLIVRYRERILVCLAIAAVLLVVLVRLALGSGARAWRVLLPMSLSSIIVVALLHASGIPMSLFHLIALVLAAGLGLDYALFFERADDDPAEQARTLHAVLVCTVSTLLVFALLASSSLPVLRAIGLTVTLGVVSNFVLALLLSRTPGARAHG